MEKLPHKPYLVWLDMEMTGLDPEKEKIIEVATVITDSDLNVVAEGPDLVVRQSAAALNRMDNWNKKQHGGSGLIAAVRKSKVSVKEAETQTLEFLKKHCVEGKSPLCGNSVHHDKRFIIKYMPKLARFLHYRIVDVSTVKELTKRWYSDKKNKKLPKKNASHRAMDDVLESIEELKQLRKHFFKRSAKTEPKNK
jgi:oligoribonuclease